MRLLSPSFDVVPSGFDESSLHEQEPKKHVVQSAGCKADDVAQSIDDGIIIGADTIVVVDDEILGKPVDYADAWRMLKLLSGRSHFVYTGLCVIQRQGGKTIRQLEDYVSTEVVFGLLTDDIIDAYVSTGEPMDKAGAYGIQELGSLLVERISGDYFNVVGLPIYRLSRMLLELGLPVFGEIVDRLRNHQVSPE